MALVEFRKNAGLGEAPIYYQHYFRTRAMAINNRLQVPDTIRTAHNYILDRIDNFERLGSGWVYVRTINVRLYLYRHQIVTGRSYIPTPTTISGKHAIVNVKNEDDKCFKWAVLSAIAPASQNASRVSQYAAAAAKEQHRFRGLHYPVSLHEIEKFEAQNPDLSIYIYELQHDTKLTPRYQSQNKGKPIDLLLLQEGPKGHYCWIKQIDRFMWSMSKHSKHFCRSCMRAFSKETYTLHVAKCKGYSPEQEIQYPAKGEMKSFSNYSKQMLVPGTIYLDFECALLKPDIVAPAQTQIPEPRRGRGRPPQKPKAKPESSTSILNKHVPSSFTAYLVTIDGVLHKPVMHRVDEADPLMDTPEKLMAKLVVVLDEFANKVDQLCRRNAPMQISQEQQAEYWRIYHHGGTCSICHKAILTKAERDSAEAGAGIAPVRDHCHITGQFRGVAHSDCNAHFTYKRKLTGEKYMKKTYKQELQAHYGPENYEQFCNKWNSLLFRADSKLEDQGENSYIIHEAAEKKVVVPVMAHNMRGYDGHLILRYCNEHYKNRPINCIPNNSEKYMMFEIGNLKFLDTFQFLGQSLDNLVKIALASSNKMVHFNTWAGSGMRANGADPIIVSDRQAALDVCKLKGVYPYEYVDSFSRFSEKALPAREAFASKLLGTGGNTKHITKEMYQRAQKVWELNGCETFGDYHDIYQLTDVLLMADVFEAFRTMAFEAYGLDPWHYFTLPGLAWDAMLKMMGVKLELISDEDMYQFFEKGIRGGISMITHRYAKANNPEVVEYDPSKPSSAISYVDANNLYGWGMVQALPKDNYKWIGQNDVMMSWTVDEWTDYIMRKSPNGPQGITLKVDVQVPGYLHDELNDYPLLPERADGRLLCTLADKQEYVIHFRYLQEALKRGYKLTKVHAAVTYNQSCWLKEFIDFNTKHRAATKNDAEKDMYKLMNNAVYGKTLENLRKRQSIKLVTKEKRMLELIALPFFDGAVHIYSEHLISVGIKKEKVMLDNLPALGQAILDLSKVRMSEIHYDLVRAEFGEHAKLLFTDTDSLCYHIQTDDIEDFYKRNFDQFDFSEYHSRDPMLNLNKKHCKEIGLVKNECYGHWFAEFAGLRSKMYALRRYETMGPDVKKAKGVSKAVTEERLSFEMYRAMVQAGPEAMVHKEKITCLRTRDHVTTTEMTEKVALSANDTKRYITFDGMHTLAPGHRDIPREEYFKELRRINEF